jgi:hypothetical protein
MGEKELKLSLIHFFPDDQRHLQLSNGEKEHQLLLTASCFDSID